MRLVARCKRLLIGVGPCAAALLLASGPWQLCAEEPDAAPAPATQAATPEAAPATPAPPETQPAARAATAGKNLAALATQAIRDHDGFAAKEHVHVRATSSGGVIHLSGTTGTIFDREEAARLAEGIEGVALIRPSISVKSPAAIDPVALKDEVEKAVRAQNVDAEGFAAEVDARGVVTLKGAVTHEWRAVNAVKKVAGVTAIAHYAAQSAGPMPPKGEPLAVLPPSPAQDTALLELVKADFQKVIDKERQALAGKEPGLARITQDVERGWVKLKGHSGLRDWYYASRVASLVPGILGVNNEVRLAGHSWREGQYREEKAIEADARTRLRALRLGRINVQASGSRIVLSGRVASEDDAYRALEAVAKVSGVQEVVNALTYSTRVARS